MRRPAPPLRRTRTETSLELPSTPGVRGATSTPAAGTLFRSPKDYSKAPRDYSCAALGLTPGTPITEASGTLPEGFFKVTSAAIASVALFRGVGEEALANASGMPLPLLRNYLRGKAKSIQIPHKVALCDVLGIDIESGRLRGNQVHFFDLGKLARFSTPGEFADRLRALSYLLRGTKCAALKFPTLPMFKLSPVVHVVQNVHFRIVLLGARKPFYLAEFKPELLANDACEWARGARKLAVAPVVQHVLAQRILNRDLLPMEFDEIFRGDNVVTWEEIEQAARTFQVSKDEILAWIETVGENREAIAAIQDARSASEGEQAPAPETKEARTGTRG
jgi:hypothetical protein